MAPQPSSAKNGTLQSDVDIPSERDRCYGPLPPKRSGDDDNDDDDELFHALVTARTLNSALLLLYYRLSVF